jgi:hypothetical protein
MKVDSTFRGDRRERCVAPYAAQVHDVRCDVSAGAA